MGLLFALIGALGYGLETTFMAKHFRTMNPFKCNGISRLSMIVTGSVLLLMVPLEAYSAFPGFAYLLALSIVMATIADFGYAQATRYMPVGVANASVMAVQTIFMVLWGLLFFGEHLGTSSYVLIAFILTLNLFLAVQSYTSTHTFETHKGVALFYVVFNGLFQSVAFAILAKIARDLDPFLTAYLWEAGIGIFSFLLFLLFFRTHKFRHKMDASPRVVWAIAWKSAPAVIGIAFYTVALSMAPLGLVHAAFTTVAIFASIFGRIIYKEYLSLVQVIAFAGLILALAVFKYVS